MVASVANITEQERFRMIRFVALWARIGVVVVFFVFVFYFFFFLKNHPPTPNPRFSQSTENK